MIFLKDVIRSCLVIGLLVSTTSAYSGGSGEGFFDPNLGSYNNFGYSADIDGGTAVAGAPNIEEGSGPETAYIYKYDGLGWNLDTTLSSPNSVAEEHFGYAVAVDSNVIAVGAPSYGSDRGAVYVYEYSSGQWTGPNTLTATDGSAGEMFGYSVDVQGNTIVVGAASADNDKGAAYVFEKNGSSWSQVQKLIASDGQGIGGVWAYGDIFGSSVEIDGNRIVVGAPNVNIGSGNASKKKGAAYIFEKTGGNWPSTESYPRLTADDGVALDLFGRAVAINGDTIAIGAYNATGGCSDAGKVYIYDWNDTDSNWVEAGNPLEDPTPTSNGNFGRSVSLGGNSLLVGAPGDMVNGIGTGNTYLCTRDGDSWEMEEYNSSELAADDRFGFAVSLGTGYMVVGAYKKDSPNPSVTNCGAVYLFGVFPADLNRDGRADFKDLAIFSEQWLLEKLSYDIAPHTGDGIVNFFDYVLFADNWQGDTIQLSDFSSQWLKPSAYNADIAPKPAGDGIVNMLDFAIFAEDWLKAD